MNKHILLSIKQKYLDLIASGEKNIEMRKLFCGGLGDRVYLVCKKQVHGYFDVFSILDLRTEEWCRDTLMYPYKGNKMKINFGISKDELRQYTGGDDRYVTGIYIPQYFKYDQPIPIEEFGISRSPQNYCFAKQLPTLFPSSQP